ncbi:MAG TPA: glycosyltransferase [Chthoniobacterales bacterium]|nr:glycosyltransferase [Chthoniobacterales bacterium]
MEYLVAAGALLWVALLLVPWRPWDTRERLEAIEAGVAPILSDITVLVPARNEAASIRRTLAALRKQGVDLKIVLVNDQSSDETASIARSTLATGLSVIDGTSLPDEWTGKLWALEQGFRTIGTDLVLLLDADIELEPGMVGALKQKLLSEKLDLVSIMAWLRMETFWEKLLAPAFIYFFKLVYPFSFGNSPDSTLGVAAGGCILVRADALRKAGAFWSIRNAIIDDCALASQIKASGGRTWIGLSRSVRSHRPYPRFATFCEMVARTAYTQLRYSIGLLLATTLLMALVFLFPFLGLSLPSLAARCFAFTGVCAMFASYLPTLRYYRRSGFWALALPLVGCLYLVMTWASAVRFWQGKPSEWKGRSLHRSQISRDL